VNLQQLSYFVAIARTRNFTRAAEQCFVAQPALSQQIRRLEDELGLPVFERRRRGVSLTVAGTAFLAYAEQALQLVAEGRQRVSDLHDVRKGAVAVMCLPTVATYWLPQVIVRFRERHPDVEIRIHEQPGCGPSDIRDAIVDLGVVQLADDAAEAVDRTVDVEPLFVDEQLLVLSADHPLVRHYPSADRAVPLQALAREAFVLTKPSCGMSRVVADAFASAGIQPRVRLETGQVEAVCEMVRAGLGIGLMPAMAMHRDHPGITTRRIRKPAPRRTIALAAPAASSMSSAAAAFAELVRAAARADDPGTARRLPGPGVSRQHPAERRPKRSKGA
jgi:LysR family hydrogen peroxide-inducible transcriptional activator